MCSQDGIAETLTAKTSVICHFIAQIPLLERLLQMTDACCRSFSSVICHESQQASRKRLRDTVL